jgi:hypothetical protein
MSAKSLVLLFILYAGPGIAALLFLALGFALARTRLEVLLTATVAGVLALVQAAELYWLWGLRLAWGGESGDPLVIAGAGIAAIAAMLTVLFVRRRLRPLNAGLE